MKRFLAFTLAFTAVICCQAKIVTDSIESRILGETVKYNVYLPHGFDNSGKKKYPVLYLLHGFTDTYQAWVHKGNVQVVADELTASGEICPMVIIMPNAGGPETRTTWNGYYNMEGWNYEDFFYKELIPQVEKKYCVYGDKHHRAVSGLSMGGGGSLIYVQRHPDMFSSCYAMSAWLDSGDTECNINDKATVVRKAVHDFSALTFIRNADDKTLSQMRTVRWMLDCGDDDFLLESNMDFYREMRHHKVPCEFRVRNGSHSWEYWHTALRTSLPFATRGFEL